MIVTKGDAQGGTSFATTVGGDNIELVYVAPGGGLSFGEHFLGSGWSAEWVPTLVQALRMAHNLAESHFDPL